MALTRAFLKSIGLNDEQIAAVIENHTETVDALKADRDKYKTEADKVSGLQDELKTAKEDAGFKAKYEKEHADFEKYKSDTDAKESAAKTKMAYRKLLSEAGIAEKYLDTVLRVTDLSGVMLDKDGNIEGADKISENAKTEWAEFVTKTNSHGTKTPTPPVSGGNSVTKESIMNIKDSAERQKAIAENHELFGI